MWSGETRLMNEYVLARLGLYTGGSRSRRDGCRADIDSTNSRRQHAVARCEPPLLQDTFLYKFVTFTFWAATWARKTGHTQAIGLQLRVSAGCQVAGCGENARDDCRMPLKGCSTLHHCHCPVTTAPPAHSVTDHETEQQPQHAGARERWSYISSWEPKNRPNTCTNGHTAPTRQEPDCQCL